MRFKSHNVTILLLVSPVDPFNSIKETLLNALRVRDIKEINGVAVPDKPSLVELGVPVDRNNLEKGWSLLRTSDECNGDTKKQAGQNIPSTNPQAADIRDGQAVAFRFRTTAANGTTGDEGEMEVDDPEWDVLIPTYDEEEEDE